MVKSHGSGFVMNVGYDFEDFAILSNDRPITGIYGSNFILPCLRQFIIQSGRIV